MSADAALPLHAEAVVIGGGAMGCSALYHLAKAGITDCVLLERNQLTSGTTWHSAAQVRQLRSTRNMTRLVQYSARLYSELEAETGQITGWYQTGSVSIATNPDRLTHIRRQAALAYAFGLQVEEIDAGEVQRLWPMANCDDVIGAVYSPDDGRVNPSDFCQALVKGAKSRGACVFENTAVTGFVKSGGRIAGVETSNGTIKADTVIICGGLWSREIAGLGGVEAPLVPCEHFYLLTKAIDGIAAHLPSLSDHDSHLYIRDEVGGLLVGCFEPRGKPIDPATLGENFVFGLLNEDWDHFEPMMRHALHRIPALETAEVRMLLNGPESFTPDGAFLLGESAETSGLWLCCGMNSVGIATGGGAGWALAQWIKEGVAPFSLNEVDPRRFPAVQNRLDTLMERASEVLGHHYAISYPGHQWSTARDLRKTPLHDEWVMEKARFGQFFGWERPLYFNSDGEPALTYGKPEWFDQVGREVDAAHTRAAIFDLSTFGKIRVRGAGAERFLNRVCANDMTRAPGRAIYTSMLNSNGGFESDLTALRLAQDDYLLYVGSTAPKRDMAWLRRHLGDENVTLTDETESMAVLGLMGPGAVSIAVELRGKALLDLGYFRHCEAEIAGIRVRAARLSYVGEAGWELTCEVNDAKALYKAFKDAGAEPACLYAQSSMRIEKRFLAMGHDLDGDVTPIEAGLDFAVKKDSAFIGSDAVAARRREGPRTRLVTIFLDDASGVPLGDEPVYVDGKFAGQAASASFGYRVQRPVLLATLSTEVCPNPEGARVEVDVAGERFAGSVSLKPAFDAEGMRMRPGNLLKAVS